MLNQHQTKMSTTSSMFCLAVSANRIRIGALRSSFPFKYCHLIPLLMRRKHREPWPPLCQPFHDPVSWPSAPPGSVTLAASPWARQQRSRQLHQTHCTFIVLNVMCLHLSLFLRMVLSIGILSPAHAVRRTSCYCPCRSHNCFTMYYTDSYCTIHRSGGSSRYAELSLDVDVRFERAFLIMFPI